VRCPQNTKTWWHRNGSVFAACVFLTLFAVSNKIYWGNTGIELPLPAKLVELCGVFRVESFSVMMQVGWFKYTKRRYGEGRRILLMSPVHHHYQKKGIFETKIVLRFWIISLLLAAITLVTLKIR